MGIVLGSNWYLLASDANQYATPAEIDSAEMKWIPAIVPGTVAHTLDAAGLWQIDQAVDFDAKDWWYRIRFDQDQAVAEHDVLLRFDGLATLCDIWLNGESIGSTRNMFLPHEFPAPTLTNRDNELYLCFRSLREALLAKKPRPRWKTNLPDHQNLRFFRTSLLGRMSSWSPPIPAIGPWRTVSITTGDAPRDLKIVPEVLDGNGIVDISFLYRHDGVDAPDVFVTVGDAITKLETQSDQDHIACHGRVVIKNVAKWWPHTHGEPCLYSASIRIESKDGRRDIELLPIGFKKVDLDQSNGGFKLSINGSGIFCRGACWTVNDIVSMSDDISGLRETLSLVCQSGANMIRIGGTMIYESENFYRLCDELGILVWQDFQFANMDYPLDDDSFVNSVTAEVKEQLRRQIPHACLTIHCGSSELDQQASMMGVSNSVVDSLPLSSLIGGIHRNSGCKTPFVRSSPTGGSLPFHTHQGVAHYYGVGAYLRDPAEVRRHDVRFSSECLGFANVPQRATRDKLFSGAMVVTHDPRWKARTPRDRNTGWDFEDVRDFYLKLRYGVDPVQLRSQDPARYLQLSEVVSAEIMSRVMQEWRSAHSNCNGALIWFLKDLWPGAGWGIIDSDGIPKAAYYLLKEVWQPVALLITDESLNGLHFHIVNESAAQIEGRIRVTLIKNGNTRIAQGSRELLVEPGTTSTIESTRVFESFLDINYSYKFGPCSHDIVHVELLDNQGIAICENSYFPDGQEVFSDPQTAVTTSSSINEAGDLLVDISSSHFLYRVSLEIPGYMALENFFNLQPEVSRVVKLQPVESNQGGGTGYLNAINLDHEIRINQPAGA